MLKLHLFPCFVLLSILQLLLSTPALLFAESPTPTDFSSLMVSPPEERRSIEVKTPVPDRRAVIELAEKVKGIESKNELTDEELYTLRNALESNMVEALDVVPIIQRLDLFPQDTQLKSEVARIVFLQAKANTDPSLKEALHSAVMSHYEAQVRRKSFPHPYLYPLIVDQLAQNRTDFSKSRLVYVLSNPLLYVPKESRVPAFGNVDATELLREACESFPEDQCGILASILTELGTGGIDRIVQMGVLMDMFPETDGPQMILNEIKTRCRSESATAIPSAIVQAWKDGVPEPKEAENPRFVLYDDILRQQIYELHLKSLEEAMASN